ncbi:hypothetical protein MNEG_2712 [Monoraphidium neglectum]|uniref:Uncharacterized protein n=1 Tax=Monoraphidium neglectum TaxID=145388 RepID=A0A0D2NKC9_9CHLO|nr:hypothetical protein MNEG_2712 [Monoraphidium neglectum]KIZ05246.1 hypothetical protein MNEG_2712 [Monoraphidium neglectum]|eukprot:XP_013904265.1 hypothetical protein MNEG_2712 [Monoraphidium neglectum]
MSRARRWLDQHPSTLLRVLEGVVRFLNVALAVAGLVVFAWGAVTLAQIKHMEEPRGGGGSPSPSPPPSPSPKPGPQPPPRLLGGVPGLAPLLSLLPGAPSDGLECPWFVYAFAAVGAATAVAALTALAGTALRSVVLVNLNVLLMCLVLTAQACVGVAAFLDHSWERRLPDIDEAAKAWLAKRLQVVKWVGAGLFLLQLVTLLLSCGLQSAYATAEEAAEDEEEEAAWRRRPLLQGEGRAPTPPWGVLGGPQPAAARGITPPLPGSRDAAAGAATPDPEEAAWRARMQERYGLDTTQFGGAAGAAGQGRQRGGGSSEVRDRGGCVVM